MWKVQRGTDSLGQEVNIQYFFKLRNYSQSDMNVRQMRNVQVSMSSHTNQKLKEEEQGQLTISTGCFPVSKGEMKVLES